MTGSYAKILRRCADFLHDLELAAICPNWQSYQEVQKEVRFAEIDYLYSGLNDVFDKVDIDAFSEKYASINLYEVLAVDKTHFKKMPGDYQLRYLSAIGRRLEEIFERSRPDYLVIPIIETVDAMLAYRMSAVFGVRPVIYCHARFASLSFFSHSHYELLPSYTDDLERSPEDEVWAEEFLDKYRANPGPFNYRPAFPGGEVYSDFSEETNALQRLRRNIWLKSGIERHNRLISLWINFQVHFQRLFVPVRNAIFYLIERFDIRPKPIPETEYDFFPLHFSPESSINVPAPYYIDQTRVVDRILLQRKGNRPLVVKEHPAMFGFRGRGFYDALKRRPFVQFVHRQTPSYQLIRKANTVYSVTGTVCVEAFFFGVNWVQFGENFLSDWTRQRQSRGASVSPKEFICSVRSAASDFVLYSPGVSFSYDKILFSKKNVEKLCAHLRFHISHDREYQLRALNVSAASDGA